VFDARGHLHEPHTGRVVPLGTIEVRRHLREVERHTLPELQMDLPQMAIFPTCGPGHRYGAILFVEKEGFLPLFRAVRLAERYDLAIMSTKGLSVTASRLLVDQLCATHQVPLLVLHDFDKSGFSILGTLRRDTRRYAFRNRIEVVDLGLRLEDVEASGLETEDVVHRSDPAPNLRENGATEQEIAFLYTRRVELNAFASADFVAWIERKLEQYGVAKIVPDQDTLTLAYRRAVAARYVTSRLESAVHDAQRHAADASVPDGLVTLVAAGLRNESAQSWDDMVQRLAMQRTGPDEG
jgi:DNA topoisomerase VI subunit A